MAVEARLMFYSKHITRCIKYPQIISHLEADLIIPSDECSKLKKKHMDGDSFKANEMMIDCLLKSTAKGKWTSFLKALEESEYGYLKYLLETDGKPNVKDDREGKIIRVFTPYLEKNLEVNDIITELYSRKVISDVDVEQIRAIHHNMGNICATTMLLERMQCRQSPDEWFYQFLDVLVHQNLKHIVEEIEPDFLQCPEMYLQSKGMDCESVKPEKYDDIADEPSCSTNSDVQEHMLTDYGEAAEEMDESAPGPRDDDDLSDDLKVNEASYTDVCKDEMYTYATTQGTLIHTRQSTVTNTSPESLESKIESRIRTPPEGQEVDCEDSVSANKKETINKEPLSNNEVHSEVASQKGSDELVGSNNDVTLETQLQEKHGMQPIAERLYPFQHELAEKALAGKNTIICAPTNSGKTWVATHIIDCHLRSTAIGKDKRRVAFMARNGALVKQQMDFISKELTYAKIKHIEGNSEESLMMNAFLEDYNILVFTPQILVNNLDRDTKSVSVFSLLIFDECHHVKGNEPYNALMKRYLLEKSDGIKGLPQIIGLTATIGTGRAKSESDALDHIFRVCANLDARCLSTVEKNKEDLAKHFSVPREEKIVMKNRQKDPCRGILLEAVKKTADVLEDLALMEHKLISVMHKCPKDLEAKGYELWVASVINAAESISGGQTRDITSAARHLQIYYSALEINRLLRKTDVAIYLAKKHGAEFQNQESLTCEETSLLKSLIGVQKDLKNVESENPNVQVSGEIIRSHFTDKDADVDSRVMVFVHARATCRALADFLNDELEDIHIKASPFIGKETRGTDKGMTEEEQTQILNEFKEGTFKVLVATSIGMEGLNVPDCNMTLNYNFNGNEITKIQMSGRSRKSNSKEIQMRTEADFAKDTIVMYRIKLMNLAIERFKASDVNTINRKILEVQKKSIDDYKWDLKCSQLKRNKQSDENDFEIQCRGCGIYICHTSNLRQLGTSYLVALEDFNGKINKEPHTKRANMGVLQKKFKMLCKHCPKDWGIIAVKDEIEFFVLKLDSLKFISSDDPRSAKTYKKWVDMPYKIKEVATCDLEDIYKNN